MSSGGNKMSVAAAIVVAVVAVVATTTVLGSDGSISSVVSTISLVSIISLVCSDNISSVQYYLTKAAQLYSYPHSLKAN